MTAIGDIADRLAAQVDAVVPELLPAARRCGGYWSIGSTAGEPGASLYIHRHGARAGRWTDAATGQCGDALDLVAAVLGTDLAGAAAWARGWLGIGPVAAPARPRPEAAPRRQDEDDVRKAAADARFIREVLAAARPIAGTPAGAYLRWRIAGRDIPADLDPAVLGFVPAVRHPTGVTVPALVAKITAATDAARVTGLHLIGLTKSLSQ